jgi:HNH endonuclease
VSVRNGVVVYAPGELNLGRSTRHPNRAQRRTLRGLYPICAIPGCGVVYDSCDLHHVIWWLNNGRTDLANLLPLCSKHHHAVHDRGWQLTLDKNRNLTVMLPDGTTMSTGPPKRNAA